jgi:4-hydroxy-3-methylbut-2-en-1-yl diphosphate synthase IspG/GcpE
VEAAIAAFDADVQAARERHGIAELLCVVGAVVAGEGEGATASTAIAVSSYGAASMTPVLALAAQRQAREMHMRIFDGMFAPGGEDADDGEGPSK